MSIKYILILFISANSLLSCGTSLKLWNSGDLQPPVLLSHSVIDSSHIRLEYDEEVSIEDIEVSLADVSDDTKTIRSNATLDANNSSTLMISISPSLEVGKEYSLQILASDTHLNTSLSVLPIVGLNGRIPDILINEFLCEGSKTRPDKVELIALSDGSLAALALQQGGARNFKTKVDLPPIEVSAGDFIVVHLAPQIEDASLMTNETTSKTDSTHPQAIDSAWDIFAEESQRGLSNTNGSLSIVNLSNYQILDSVIFSVKDDETEDKYRGFSSKSPFTWANEIHAQGEWTVENESIGVLPSDTVNPKDSTTTRSINRNSQSTDTNSKNDWHIGPTSSASFGAPNTDEIYEP